MARHENANQSYFELGVAILELASQAYENYRVRSLSEKRRLASALLSNLTVTGGNVVPVYKEPFGLLAEGLSRPNWLPLPDDLRAWFADELPRVAQAIPIHILYEDLHWSSPWPRVRPTLPQGGVSHGQ